MTPNYLQVALAISSNDYGALVQIANSSPLADIVELRLLLGPLRLAELTYRQNSRFHLRSPFSTPIPSIVGLFSPLRSAGAEQAAQVLPNVLAKAFKDSGPLSFAERAPVALVSEIAAAQAVVIARIKAKQTVRLTIDASKTLPEPTGVPAALNDANYAASALRLGVTVPAIKAVAKVESGGRSGFDGDGRSKILFEAHHFSKHTRHRFDLTHPHLSTLKRSDAKTFYKWQQYPRLFEAMLLDPVAACMSASWGKFQVLGSTHNGWGDPVSFAVAMFESEDNHLKSFEAYCAENRLVKALKDKDWAAFAKGYNGANYADFNYDTQMATAYTTAGGL